MFCDSGLGLLSGCPSTTDKWFNRHSLAKKKKRQKKSCTNMYFSLRDQGYTRKCSMYILHCRGMKNMCKKSNNDWSLLIKPFNHDCYVILHFGMSEHSYSLNLQCKKWRKERKRNTHLYYGTFNEIKSFPKTNRQIPSRK